MKLLVNAPTGRQEIIEVGEGGGYFDISRVLWDEREDGPLPEITLGAMVRAGDALAVDADLLAASQSINLDAVKVAAIAKTYRDVDGVYDAAIGQRKPEYDDAEADARAYVATGYTGTTPESVECYARKEGQTNQWAADAIIARADAFRAAKSSMRIKRMDRQADMVAAATLAELNTAVAAWDAYITGIRAELGL